MRAHHGFVRAGRNVVHLVDVVVQLLLGMGLDYLAVDGLPGLFGGQSGGLPVDGTIRRPEEVEGMSE